MSLRSDEFGLGVALFTRLGQIGRTEKSGRRSVGMSYLCLCMRVFVFVCLRVCFGEFVCVSIYSCVGRG